MILEDVRSMLSTPEFKGPEVPAQLDIELSDSPPRDSDLSLQDHAELRIPASRRAAPREWIGFIPVHSWEILNSPGLAALGKLRVIETGSRHEVRFHPRSLFSELFKKRADAFYLVHNHPSGNSYPSSADRQLTRRAQRLAQELGVPLLGHLIVTRTTNHWIRMEAADMGGHDESNLPCTNHLRPLRKTY
jgi:hypothetical protein